MPLFPCSLVNVDHTIALLLKLHIPEYTLLVACAIAPATTLEALLPVHAPWAQLLHASCLMLYHHEHQDEWGACHLVMICYHALTKLS